MLILSVKYVKIEEILVQKKIYKKFSGEVKQVAVCPSGWGLPLLS